MATTSETLYRSVSSVWRTLRSMRTALILLLVVGVASIFGSLVPQAPNTPGAVADLFLERPVLARLYQALGLFDVYGSWWFTLAYVLLLISLASCLIPRTRAAGRGLGRRPAAARELESLRHFEERTVASAPEVAVERSHRILRRRRFRVARDGDSLAAEKGATREGGSLLFHWSLFVILVGAVYGKGFGFIAQATVVEGETWTEAHSGYDLPPREGRFFSEGMHAGFQVRVEDFDAAFHPNGVPRDFVSRVELIGPDGTSLGNREIRVNEPLEHRGVKLYQLGYGWAPVIEVRHQGSLLAGGPIVFVTDDPGDLSRPWRGVIKLPSLRPQVGLELTLLPDPVAATVGAPMLEARNPFTLFQAWRGDLRLTAAQTVFRLDKRGLEPWESGGLGIGQTVELPGGLEIRFTELRQYTQFLVKRDPGLGVMLGGAVLILVGILPALYSSRRKVWVRVEPAGGGARLQVGGFALQRKGAFEEEFRGLVRELVQ
jgi:cytochrome c biogenesis protein